MTPPMVADAVAVWSPCLVGPPPLPSICSIARVRRNCIISISNGPNIFFLWIAITVNWLKLGLVGDKERECGPIIRAATDGRLWK